MDVFDKIVGRLVLDIVVVFMGKYKFMYMFYVDCGDFVIVMNVEKVYFIGNKWENKIYVWYMGYFG